MVASLIRTIRSAAIYPEVILESSRSSFASMALGTSLRSLERISCLHISVLVLI